MKHLMQSNISWFASKLSEVRSCHVTVNILRTDDLFYFIHIFLKVKRLWYHRTRYNAFNQITRWLKKVRTRSNLTRKYRNSIPKHALQFFWWIKK